MRAHPLPRGALATLLVLAAAALPVQAVLGEVLTAIPPDDEVTHAVTACPPMVQVNSASVVPVCARAEVRQRFACQPAGPALVTCAMSWELTGSGSSPLLLPGEYVWDGTVDYDRCIPGGPGRPECVAPLALWQEHGEWPGLLGAAGAGSTQGLNSWTLTMPLDEPLGNCYRLAGAGHVRTEAKVVLADMVTIAQAAAEATTVMVKEFGCA